MAAPPMNDAIILRVVLYGPDGLPDKNKYGIPKRTAVQTKARVRYSTELIISRSGDREQAVLKIDLPSDVEVRTGDIVEWVDRFGVPVTGAVESTAEVLNYSGEEVYWRKVYTGSKTE